MKKTLAVLLMVVLAPLAHAGEPRAFPGAVGFGSDTPAGRGGKIIKVTSLENKGEGTLRAALAEKGKRVVVFEVGGVIDLAGDDIEIEEPFVTVAGQTAPGPGVTLIRGAFRVATHDVLFQHLRVRPGDMSKAKKSGWEPDGIALANKPQTPGPHHVVIDHCSTTWAVDENLSASGQRHEGREGTSHDVTFSNCIIAEGLNDTSHAKGPHSMGTLIHDHARNIAILGNLYASNMNRNPVLKPDAAAVVVNNLIYNPGQKAIHSYWTPKEYVGQAPPTPCTVVAVGNVLWCGPDTPQGIPLISLGNDKGEVFAEGNLTRDRAGKPVAEIGGKPTVLKTRPFWPEGFKEMPAEKVAEKVLAEAGAFPRDEIDRRIIGDARKGTGKIIDSQEQVGGYPKLKEVRRALQVPENAWIKPPGQELTAMDLWLADWAGKAKAKP